MKVIGKKEALTILENIGGRWFSVGFIGKDGDYRLLNCIKIGFDPLGYVKVKNPFGSIRNVNLQTIKELTVNKVKYRIR